MGDAFDIRLVEEIDEARARRRLGMRVFVILLVSVLAASSFVPALGCVVSGLPFQPPKPCPAQKAP